MDVTLFDLLREKGAYVAPAATDAELDECNRRLETCDFPRLPEEYVKFLKLANGFAWNGFQFFGATRTKEAITDFVLRDIVSYNDEYSYEEGILILGSFDEVYYVYDAEHKDYRSIDRLTKIQEDAFRDLGDLLFATVVAYAL
jgi:hypothetical protein